MRDIAVWMKPAFPFGAAASPAHLPAPPSTNGDVIMLTEEPAAAAAAVPPNQAAALVVAPAPEGVSPVPDRAAAPDQAPKGGDLALPESFLELLVRGQVRVQGHLRISCI